MMKVIGAGYGRTGTKSLQLALQRLGYSKCYHMEELFRNPEGVVHWKAASEKRPVDWDSLFTGYQAIVDFPGSMYYKQLADHYPDAKVILSYRDPESWYESVRSTIFGFDPGPIFKIKLLLQTITSTRARNMLKVLMLNEKSIWKTYFEGKFLDRDYAIGRYNRHVEEVRQQIPEHRLLVHQSQDGYQPLCDFLGRETPDEPYPRTNKKQDFATWAKGLVEESIAVRS